MAGEALPPSAWPDRPGFQRSSPCVPTSPLVVRPQTRRQRPECELQQAATRSTSAAFSAWSDRTAVRNHVRASTRTDWRQRQSPSSAEEGPRRSRQPGTVFGPAAGPDRTANGRSRARYLPPRLGARPPRRTTPPTTRTSMPARPMLTIVDSVSLAEKKMNGTRVRRARQPARPVTRAGRFGHDNQFWLPGAMVLSAVSDLQPVPQSLRHLRSRPSAGCKPTAQAVVIQVALDAQEAHQLAGYAERRQLLLRAAVVPRAQLFGAHQRLALLRYEQIARTCCCTTTCRTSSSTTTSSIGSTANQRADCGAAARRSATQLPEQRWP